MANFVANCIKENGLVIPVEGFTEDDFFDTGRCLAKIEQGMQWAIGDWYNSIPWGDKEAACVKAGLSYESARRYGMVSDVFEIRDRIPNLGYAHHKILAIEDLSNDQRADLLEKARKNDWTAARLRQERDRLLGRPEKVALPEFDERVENLLKELPTSISRKAKNEVRKVYSDLKREFSTVVERETSKRLQAERTKMLSFRKQVEEEHEQVKAMARGVTAVISEEEYKLIRGLLHPDRHQDDQERYGKAFEAFQRLEKTINPNIPAAVLKSRGWGD